MDSKPINRISASPGSLNVLALPPLPKSVEWFKSNFPSMVKYGEWHDVEMEKWRQQVQMGIGNALNSVRTSNDSRSAESQKPTTPTTTTP